MDYSENRPHSSKTEGIKRNLEFSFHESTPVFKSKSRKRKTFIDSKSQFFETFDSNSSLTSFQSPSNSDTSYDTCISDSYNSYDYKNSLSQNKSIFCELSFDINHVKVSSPLNKNNETLGLSNSLEKCSLFDFDTCSKRRKWDNESPNGKRKSNSAPGTPNHSGNESESSFKKYHSIDFTPTKSQYDSKFGFNSPECKKILYPQLAERKPAIKPKSPQKLREELKRLRKPAKKRLFLSHDFVYLFIRASNHRQIVNKIFSYLNDSDLINVVKVSKLWKNAVSEDPEIYLRYKKFNTYMIRSKENLRNYNDSLNLSVNRSQYQFSVEKENYCTPEAVHSPVKTAFQKYTRLAEKLTPNQQLAKCPNCGDPSVLERNIAQCTKHGCQYIWCNRCLSGSKRGPDYFLCKCEKGTTPPRTEKYSLGDISNIESPTKNCSFLNDNYYNASASINISSNTSSGYFSQSETEKSNNLTLNSAKIVKNALGVVNRNLSMERRVIEPERNLTSFHSVAEYCMRKKLHKKDSYEPSSPPKVKMSIVGSEKSKKSLRRLIR